MNFLIGILEEELANSKRLADNYEKELNKLPKGNVSKKHINGHAYYYLQYKENNEVNSRYLGKLDKKHLKKYMDICKQKKEINANLNKVKKQIKVLNRLLNDKKIQSAA